MFLITGVSDFNDSLGRAAGIYCLGSPLHAHNLNPVYGTVDWLETYDSADVKGISYSGHECPIYKHGTVGSRVGDLQLILPSPRFPDFVWTWMSECVVTDRVLKLLKEVGFTGFRERPARIVKVKRIRKNSQVEIPTVWELVAEGKGGEAHPDSGISLLYLCTSCGLRKYSSFQNGLVVDTDQWDGSDFFTVNGYPAFILITERVKNFIVENKLLNCSVLRAEEIQWGDIPRPEDHPEHFIPGRATASPDYLAKKATELLSRVKGPTADLVDGKDCFDLLSSLGQLRFAAWSADFPEERVHEIHASAEELSDRLRKILMAAHRKEIPGARFEAGIAMTVKEIGEWLRKTQHKLVAREMGAFAPFSFYVLQGRDKLGYALKLLESIGVRPSADLMARIEELDMSLRNLLPELVASFRRTRENLGPSKGRFPEFFWWRGD